MFHPDFNKKASPTTKLISMLLLLALLLTYCYYPATLFTNTNYPQTTSLLIYRDNETTDSLTKVSYDDENLQEWLSSLRSLEVPAGSPMDIYPVRESIAVDLWPGIYFPEDVEIYKPLIEDLHAQGIKYMIYRNFYMVTDVNYTYLCEYYPGFNASNAGFIDLDGNPYIVDYDPYGTPIFRASTNRPYWQSFLINSTKLAIDAGVDAVVFDVGFGHYPPNELNFDPDSIKDFREYLAEKYTSEELASKFNISDISTFDFGQYLRDLGYNASSLREALTQGTSLGYYADLLWSEWCEFHLKVLVEFYKRLYTEVKEYAQSKGRDFYVFSNIYHGLDPQYNILYLINYVDGIYAEIFFDDLQYPNRTPATVYKVAYSLGKHYIPMTSPSNDSELYPLYIAELFACGSWTGGAGNYTPYFLFVNSHPELFSKEQDGEIGLVYSLASSENYSSFEGAFYLLSDTQRSFDVIVFGDNKWFNESLTLNDLLKYRAILLPNTGYLTDEQVELLLNYAEQGGILIGIGSVGTRNETGEIVNSETRTTFISLFNGSIVSYGSGTVISWTSDIALQYLLQRNTTLLEEFENRLSEVFSPEIITSFTHNTTIFQYWDPESNAMIFHFLNREYDSKNDVITPQHDVSFKFTLRPELDGLPLEIRFYSPNDYFEGIELTYSSDPNGYVEVTIPKVHIWGILRVEAKKKAVQEDLVINSPTVLKDQVIVLNGNLLVNSKLTLENVILKMNSSLDRVFRIEVYEGGELVIKDSVITAYDPKYHYYVKVNKGSRFYMENSELSHAGVWGPMYAGGLWINTDDVIILNCTIHSNYDYGIHVYNASYVEIINCKIYGNNIGIYLLNSSFVTISKCNIYDNSIGIYEKGSYYSTIKHSHISNNLYWGITIWDSLFPLISDSTIHDSVHDGIIIWYSFFAKIYNCKAYSNENGFNIRYTPLVTVSSSEVYNNEEAGLFFFHVELLYGHPLAILDSLGTIVANSFYNNTYGIYMLESEKTKIEACNILDNTWGIYVEGTTQCTFIFRSNFIDNTDHIYVDEKAQGKIQFDNITIGNYWDDHSGEDADGDGIIDTPYTINSVDKDYKPLANPVTIVKIEDIYGPMITDIQVVKEEGNENYNLTISVNVTDDSWLSWVLMNGTIHNLPGGENYPLMRIMVYFYDPFATILGYDRSNFNLLPSEGYPLKTCTASTQFTFPLSYKPHFKIFAVDTYGNWAENDSTTPHITGIFWDPSSPEYDEEVTVFVHVFDQSRISECLLSYFNGTEWNNVSMIYNEETNAMVGSIPKQPYGVTVEFKVIVKDTMNNIAVSATYSYTVKDTTPPILRIIQPSGGETISNDVNVTWESYDEGSGLKEFKIYLNGTLKATLPPTTSCYLLSNLTPGSYNVTVEAVDNAGNRATASIVFKYVSEEGGLPNSLILMGGTIAGVVIIVTVFLMRKKLKD